MVLSRRRVPRGPLGSEHTQDWVSSTPRSLLPPQGYFNTCAQSWHGKYRGPLGLFGTARPVLDRGRSRIWREHARIWKGGGLKLSRSQYDDFPSTSLFESNACQGPLPSGLPPPLHKRMQSCFDDFDWSRGGVHHPVRHVVIRPASVGGACTGWRYRAHSHGSRERPPLPARARQVKRRAQLRCRCKVLGRGLL